MKYPTCHLAQQGSNYERESWHVVVLCIHDQYLHTNSLTMCHVGIGRPANAERGREKQLLTVTQTVKTWQAEREWEQKQRNAYSKQECARRGKHSRRMSTRNREILVQAYWVGEGLRQGCWVGGKEPVHRCTRVHKCTLVYTSAPNAHRSSGSVACTRRRSCPLFPCNTTKRGGFPGKSLIWSAVKSETKTC